MHDHGGTDSWVVQPLASANHVDPKERELIHDESRALLGHRQAVRISVETC